MYALLTVPFLVIAVVLVSAGRPDLAQLGPGGVEDLRDRLGPRPLAHRRLACRRLAAHSNRSPRRTAVMNSWESRGVVAGSTSAGGVQVCWMPVDTSL